MKSEDFENLCYFNSIKDRALIDILKESKTTVDIGRWLSSARASKFVGEDILQTLSQCKADLQIAVDNPASEEREGYSYLTKPKLGKYYKFICDSYEDTQKFLDRFYPKKIRKKKPIDPSRLVKDMKYLLKDESLGLQSIDPRDILGASMLTVYNTSSRVLSLYYANDGGFSIKGCSILNWDEKKSFAKKLRKPEETLPLFVSVGFTTVANSFAKLKTKASLPSGRTNSNTIIIWSKKLSK